jgi:hypothetical protein
MQMARGYVQQASAFSASKRNSRQCQLDDGMPVVANHRLRSSPAAETGKPDRRYCRACLLLEKYLNNTLSDISRSTLNAKFVIRGWLRRASSSLKYQHVKSIVVLIAKLYGRDVLFGRSDCCIVGGCGLREHPLLSRNATLASRFKSCVTNIYRNSHSEHKKRS